METDYKVYARDLYRIKLAAIGDKPTEKNITALQAFLNNVNDLRPKLRRELTELEKEYIAMVPNPQSDFMRYIHDVNQLYIKKLQAFANRIKREIRSFKN